MKTIAFVCYTLFITVMLHCSEQQKQSDLIKQIDYKKIEQTLSDNYIAYARKHLEEYKTIDYTPQKMGDIAHMNTFITGQQYGCFPYNAIRDEQGNNFIRIAVKKVDLAVVDWHVLKKGAHYITREDFDYCVASCVEHLNPKKTEECLDTKKNAYAILKILATKQGKTFSILTLRQTSCRENLIKQLILLQMKHAKHKSDCIIEQDLITQCLTHGDNDQSPILLTDMYQTIANKKSNTLSHIIVELQNADELCQLINKNYISSLPNRFGKTIVDIALHHFQMFTQDPSNFDLHPEQAQRARCCLFMLLRYIKSVQNGALTNDYICCDKHVITV